MMLTLDDYWMGRDVRYKAELTADIVANATALLTRVNLLLHYAIKEGVYPGTCAATGNAVASGWRPKLVNDATQNSAVNSRHLRGRAVDLRDTAGRDLARWCLRNDKALHEIGLWMEDPQWTPTWVHLQSLPPYSGRRVYVPSASAPLAAKLPEQIGKGAP